MKMFTSSDSVLLLIDHQVGTMKLIQNIPFEVVKRNTLALAKAAKALGVPIVLTTGTETKFQGPLLPEFKELFPEEYEARIARGGIVNTWNDPEFRQAVEKTKRRNLIMAGATTDVCVMPPAISARQDGYQVQVVLDASGSPYEYSEEAARLRMVQEGVTLTATNTMIAELAQDWSRPEAGEVLQIMKNEVLPQVF
ncbi:isochorismatase family protein [Aeromonas dhakensis]|uniref:isochorismatase family protein n=1 Tax=Aeromonas dhakensis TaxID=196024 RepID=UPI00208F04C5|nr:isochorismatase family protein [Aeromonas dhakensis]USP11870.1 isochorismatase family protein [Aeromonas dhakensis]